MKTRFASLLLILLCPALAVAQVTQLWVVRYHGPVGGSSDRAQAIALDSTGNVYVTGSSQGIGTGFDYATVAYDSSGNQLWVARYNGPANGDDFANGIAVDSNRGRVYVTGSSGIVAYDSSGNQLWVARHTGADGRPIAVDTNTGNVYLLGSGQVGSVPAAAIIAFDSGGNELWVALYAPPRSDSSYFAAIAVDSISGNVYAAGDSHFPAPSTLCMQVVGFDNTGTQLWSGGACGGGFTPLNFGNAITVDSSGNVYAAGGTRQDPNFWYYRTQAYDANGRARWSVLFGSGIFGQHASANAIGADSTTGNVYVTGDRGTVAYDSTGRQLWTNSFTANVVAVDSSTGNGYVTSAIPGAGTGTDYGTLAYDSNGNQLWMARYHGPVDGGGDAPSAIALDSNLGIVYVTGQSQATATSSDFATVAYTQQ